MLLLEKFLAINSNLNIIINRYLFTVGVNTNGQLGDNSINQHLSPVQTVAGGTDWSSVYAGADYSAGIKNDGTLWLWGKNNNGQLGLNDRVHRSSPVQVSNGGTNWKEIGLGGLSLGSAETSLGVKTDGTLWSWGQNAQGLLGINSFTIRVLIPTQIGSNTNWSTVANPVGYHAGAIKTDGTLWMWGYNGLYGALGDNTLTDKSSPVQTVSGGTNWKQVSCGSYHTAAIKTNGTLWIWGRNSFGQLGDNTRIHRSSPVQTVSAGTNWKQVACSRDGTGADFTAAIKTDGTLWLWGYNFSGNLGDNTRIHRSSPVQTVAGGTNWSKVSCGRNYAAALKTDSSLWLWGNNGGGQLGTNDTTNRSSPVQTISGGTNWKDVGCGDTHTAFIRS
jgi:alpha-tubulin suppressor-like RCC1 family protein